MQEKLKNIRSSPYISGGDTSVSIMIKIIISLLPIVCFAVYKYKLNAVFHIFITVSACIFVEYLFCFITKKRNTVKDGSAVVTGILIALLLPAYAPYYMGVIGGVFAIVVVKKLCGGIGKYIINPSAAAKCFLFLSFPTVMRVYSNGAADLSVENLIDGKNIDTLSLIVGDSVGSMGEVCAAALLIGAIILVVSGVIDVYIPASYTISFLIMLIIFGGRGFDAGYIAAQFAGGGFLFVAWFIATDYTTAPITYKGQVIYGILLGIFTAMVRIWGHRNEDIYFIVLIVNLFTPFIEDITIPKPFILGGGKNV